MDIETASKLFGTLGSATRLAVFRILVTQGDAGMVAGEIAKTLNISPANLSFHLKDLCHTGLIKATQEGRFQRYHADLALMVGLTTFLTEECCSNYPPTQGAQNSHCRQAVSSLDTICIAHSDKKSEPI
ncbi:ArsR/SmtB family transcription factor [Neisseria arctica]|uniref:ArsR/SmtB family transcription factor n=1 Tax=Neisseria arctica TaxID=1470200 RepID=UPI00096AD32D|nr:metalloregulator ArsR/SmtB family transcription factor [Neisseria arctica]UOO87250.1 helix-turn-helix domain-containing protein [Neisseria arctica]